MKRARLLLYHSFVLTRFCLKSAIFLEQFSQWEKFFFSRRIIILRENRRRLARDATQTQSRTDTTATNRHQPPPPPPTAPQVECDIVFWRVFFLSGSNLVSRIPPRRLEISPHTFLEDLAEDWGYWLEVVSKVTGNRKCPKNRE